MNNRPNIIRSKNGVDWKGFLALSFIKIVTAMVFLFLFFILGKIFFEGIGVINWNFLIDIPRDNMTKGGIGPAIFGTLALSLLMILFAVPLGIFTAIFINEYAADKWYSRIIRLSINNLAGVPSIVFGLFGVGFFVMFVGNKLDELLQTGLLFGQPAMLWASATLAILVLPTIIVSSVEALESVSHEQRMASYGLGASKWQTIRKVVLPQARPGILTGIILAVSRGAGETAPILFLGCAFFLPNLPLAYLNLGLFSIPMINPTDQFMALPYHIFILTTQSTNPTLTQPIQYGTALVLITITILLNITAVIFRYKFRKVLRETGKSI